MKLLYLMLEGSLRALDRRVVSKRSGFGLNLAALIDSALPADADEIQKLEACEATVHSSLVGSTATRPRFVAREIVDALVRLASFVEARPSSQARRPPRERFVPPAHANSGDAGLESRAVFHAAMNRAAMIGPTTMPSNPKTAIPPSVERSTT